MTDLTLTVEHLIQAPPARVFDAWLAPDLLARFMAPAEGVTVSHAATDPRVGGRFEIVMTTPDGKDLPHRGTYRQIVPHDRLVFSWESANAGTESEVTLAFFPQGQGTLLRLTHVRLPDEESRASHQGGWTRILGLIGGALGNKVPS